MKKKSNSKKILKIVGIIIAALAALVTLTIFIVPKVLFTNYEGLPVTGSYSVETVNAILVDDSRVETFAQDGSMREVPICIYYPVTDKDEKYPVVFFSHGAFGYGKSNYSTYMELASNGYVVISMEHPYHSFFTKDTTGKTVIVNSEFINNAMYINSEEVSEEEIFDITHEWIELRLADANFAVDTIKKATAENNISSVWFTDEKEKVSKAISEIDIEKIGFMGHSLGGATAASLGRERADIGAVIDIDGTMLGEITGVENGQNIIKEGDYNTPILSFDNEEHYTERKACAERDEAYVNNIVLSQAKEGFNTYIAGSGHMNYTDLPLFSPKLAKMLGVGDVDSEKCILKMNEIILEFFDCYLKGQGTFTVEEGYQL